MPPIYKGKFHIGIHNPYFGMKHNIPYITSLHTDIFGICLTSLISIRAHSGLKMEKQCHKKLFEYAKIRLSVWQTDKRILAHFAAAKL